MNGPQRDWIVSCVCVDCAGNRHHDWDELRSFLELNLPRVKGGKKAKYSLGVMEPKVGSHISETTGIPCQSNEIVQELLRGVRLHFDQFIDQLKVMEFTF